MNEFLTPEEFKAIRKLRQDTMRELAVVLVRRSVVKAMRLGELEVVIKPEDYEKEGISNIIILVAVSEVMKSLLEKGWESANCGVKLGNICISWGENG